MIEVTEVIYRWHRGDANAAIARSLGADRKTVRKFVNFAKEAGLSREAPLPPEPELAALLAPKRAAVAKPLPTPGRDRLVPFDAELEKLAKQPEVSIKQMWRLHLERHPETYVGYNSFKVYVRSKFRQQQVASTVRLSVAPGQQAQVDFGYAGLMVDPATGKRRKAWAFVLTLSYSRYRFVRFVFSQDAETWVDCHMRAFEFFGGVPASVICDNLKSGVLKPDLYDPVLNPLYRELEHHYDFAIDPAKVEHPQHKGRVEAAVKVVKGQLLAGREFADIDEANRFALVWCRDMNGQTEHGTTKRKPTEVFEQVEKPTLKPLPESRFEKASWQESKVHHDHMVVVKGAYYSVPTRYIGATLWVRRTDRLVQFFQDGVLVKTHTAARPGEFRIDTGDFPEGKRRFLLNDAAACHAQAQAIGPATAELMAEVLKVETQVSLRKAQKVLRLGEHYGEVNLEGACRRALHYGNLRIDALRNILEKGLARVPIEDEPAAESPAAPGFTRPGSYFAR